MFDWLKRLFGKSDVKDYDLDSQRPALRTYVPKVPPQPLAGRHLEQLENIVLPSLHPARMFDAELVADLREGGYLEFGDPPKPTTMGRQAVSNSGFSVHGKIN